MDHIGCAQHYRPFCSVRIRKDPVLLHLEKVNGVPLIVMIYGGEEDDEEEGGFQWLRY